MRLDSLIQRVTGVPMEPRAALASYDAADGTCTLWAGGGGVVRPKRELAIILGIDPERVRVIAEDTGGNFGTRNFFYPEFALVAWAARRIGRPVKWTVSRQDCFVSDYQGRDLAHGALALDQRATSSPSMPPACECRRLHRLVHPADQGHAGDDQPVPLGGGACARGDEQHAAHRALSQRRPARDHVHDRAADRSRRAPSGFDRVELRRRNVVPAHAMPYTNPSASLRQRRLRRHARARAEAQRLGRLRGARAIGARLRRGIGLGGYVESQSGAPQERAEVAVLPDGMVEVVIGTLSAHGQGHATSFAQLIAEWLGIEASRVRLLAGDTARVRAGGGSHSGRSMRMAATTIHQASGIIVERARVLAAEALETDATDLAFADGRFTVKGTDRSVSLASLAERHGPIAGTGEVDSRVGAYPYGWHVCEVEVDVETGVARIVAYCAIDVGRAVNR